MALPVTQISSIGSGTIVAGRRSAYVNDHVLTSGSIVVVTLKNSGLSTAGGGGGLKQVLYTTGSPANENSFQVVLNGATTGNVDFTYAIISGTDIVN